MGDIIDLKQDISDIRQDITVINVELTEWRQNVERIIQAQEQVSVSLVELTDSIHEISITLSKQGTEIDWIKKLTTGLVTLVCGVAGFFLAKYFG